MVNKLRQKLHKNGKKGFTLVELIVVIVIILILAAVMVPLLMNYIGQANQANAKSNASTVLSQVQADFAASQANAQTGIVQPGETGNNKINNVTIETADTGETATITAAGTDAAPVAAYAVKNVNATGKANYKEIVAFIYNDGKYSVTWTQNDGWKVANSGDDTLSATNGTTQNAGTGNDG